jgi:hypothetical protein
MTSAGRDAADQRRRRKNGNGFRYSPRFLRNWTIVLCVMVAVFPIAGFVLLAGSDSPDPQPVGLTLLVSGVALPILIGGVLGGNAIIRHGGWIGLLFFLGLATAVCGIAVGFWLVVVGWVVTALAGLGFWLIGWRAHVPMWLQLPILYSPRFSVTRGRGGVEHTPTSHRADVPPE